MQPKAQRLQRTLDIENVHKRGRTLKNNLMRIKFLRNNLNNSRVTIVISKSVAKLAVKRNALRRRVSAVLRDMLDQLSHPIDMLVILNSSAKDANSSEIRNSLSQLINKI